MSTERPNAPGIRQRKEEHLSICVDPSRCHIEGSGAGFEKVRFIHDAMPELDNAQIDFSTTFLGYPLGAPLFISCMTGGSDAGPRINRELALAAEELRIPLGLGSIRPVLRDPDLFEHFHVKKIAKDAPVLANLGAVQVRDMDHGDLFEMLRRLEVQGLVVHLNAGQELFQPDGDRDFRGVKSAFLRLCQASPLPVIVKETGFGIRPALARELLDAGAAYIDVAGAGGTNWISVESYRLPESQRGVAGEFKDWGLPTAMLLASYGDIRGRVLASGGIRSGMEAAKALAMGAELAGLALPVIRAVVPGGAEQVVRLYRDILAVLKAVMHLTGSRTLGDLRRGTVWLEPSLSESAEAFARADSRLST